MKDQNWYIILNPVAGRSQLHGVEEKVFDKFVKGLRLPIEQVWQTKYKGHGVELTKSAIALGARKIISIGGDGTNHEVVNGILSQEIVPSIAVVHAHLPLGSGNDWVKTMNIPKDIEKWVVMVQQGKTILHNAGKISFQKEGQLQIRYFVNVAGMAYDAFVVNYLEKEHVTKKSGSIYLLMILKCLFKYKKQKARIEVDDKTYSGRFYTINIGVCKYSGGGMSLVPHANPTGNDLAVTLAGDISKLSVLLNTWRFYNESILKHRKIKGFLAKRIVVESKGKYPINIEADGEFLGSSPVEITLLPAVLRVIVP